MLSQHTNYPHNEINHTNYRYIKTNHQMITNFDLQES